MDRFTTDNPETNLQALLNFAFAKDQRVVLAYEDNTDLAEYVSTRALREGCTVSPEDVLEGSCTECDCPVAVLNTVAIQAAELRGRLKMIEDILGDTYDLDHLRELLAAEKEGRLIVLPCKPGKTAYLVHDLRETEFPSVADITGPYEVYHANTKGFYIRSKRGMTYFIRWREVGEKAFWSKKKAESARDAIISEATNVRGKKEDTP